VSTIRLQYSTARNLGSWAIRYWSAGAFSHVDTLLPNGWLCGARSDKVADVPAGFQVRPPHYEAFTRIAVVELQCTPNQLSDFNAFEVAQIGKPYDGPGIAGFIFPSIFKERLDDWREPDSWFCSEEKQAALEHCGWMPRIQFPENKVTPVANYCMVLAAGGRVTLDWRS
jgi:hypothetical protein